uniref:Uncharacterized protein n=1 Tax=Chaetoceros debilis TaxID=122233 RepID=A0A7S3Q177_9STRA|mmetsp:Transcript_2897/g.4251  ORF Transcript_2897/g.4251 Transcript_2897/m.4251 type:complete len:303 (+) Transcript_2897:153-1061(+)
MNALDTTTKVQIAQGLRKGKKSVIGCMEGFKGEKTDKGVTAAPAVIVGTIGIAALGLAVSSIVMSGFLVVDVTGSFLCFFAPYMVYQKHVLRELGTFRSLLNSLRMKINGLIVENEKLTANVDRLRGSVDELETIEQDLSRLVDSNHVDELVDVIKRTKAANDQMKRNTETRIAQQLITTVLRSDHDYDLKIGPSELNTLMLRLQSQDHDFEFNRENFLKIVGNAQQPVPIEKIMQVIRNLKDDSMPAKMNVFNIKMESLISTTKALCSDGDTTSNSVTTSPVDMEAKKTSTKKKKKSFFGR